MTATKSPGAARGRPLSTEEYRRHILRALQRALVARVPGTYPSDLPLPEGASLVEIGVTLGADDVAVPYVRPRGSITCITTTVTFKPKE